MIDIYGALTRVNLHAASSVSANTNGTAIDVSGFQGQLCVTLDVGAASAGTTPVLIPTMQTSADNTTWSNVASLTNTYTDFTNVNGANAAYAEVPLDSRDCLKYVRLFLGLNGTNSPAYPVSALIIGKKKYS
jgi:hypothetical protein